MEAHAAQLDQILDSFSKLLNPHSARNHTFVQEVTCDEELDKSFKKGLSGEGLKQHSLSHKMQLLKGLQSKV